MKVTIIIYLFSIITSALLFSCSSRDGHDVVLTYTNPVLHTDYSDPDVVRSGDDYYMVASSFNCVPGLPVLHSRDLVSWELKGYALERLQPEEYFSSVRHGGGVWAPCIRIHNREFYIFYPDPDHGIFMVKATDPAGPWSEPVTVMRGKGLIDPSPLWDSDGIGEPVTLHPMPDVGRKWPAAAMLANDEFDGNTKGLQWQWHANPSMTWGYPSEAYGVYRVNCIPRPDSIRNLWDVPNLFMQKLPAEEFSATASVNCNLRFNGEEAGMVVMGRDYQYISLKRHEDKLWLRVVRCNGADKGAAEEVLFTQEVTDGEISFGVRVEPGAICRFSFGIGGMAMTEA